MSVHENQVVRNFAKPNVCIMKTETEFDYASYRKGERYGLQQGFLMGIVLSMAVTVAVFYIFLLTC